MHRLLLLGLNHATAPLEVRERLAFSAGECREALEAFRQRYPQAEAVLISTCNRVELYCARPVHGHPRPEEMIGFLADFHGIAAETFSAHLYQKSDSEVVQHLFNVAGSLDSMVVGETQILGQVRQAYDLARQCGSVGAVLNPLFQRAVAAGKLVMHETSIGEGRLSIASVAVDYAKRIFDHFGDKTVLSIGAGKMATLVLRHFQELKPRTLLVCNRDPNKAAALAQRFGGTPAALEQLGDHLVAADIVISSTGSPVPIITRRLFESLLKRRRYRPVFLIDIAMPRDIEAEVGKLENVYLYNIDDLQQVVAQTMAVRGESIESARQLIARQVAEYETWSRTRQMGPVIDRLSRHYHRIARQEVARTLNKLPNASEAEKAHLEELARRLVNKLLNDPIQALRKSAELHGATAHYLVALEKLFNLNDDTPAEEDSATSRVDPPSEQAHAEDRADAPSSPD